MIALDFFKKSNKEMLIKDGISIGLTNDNANILAILSVFAFKRKTVFVILPNLNEAQKYYDLLSAREDNCLFYPCDDLLTSEMIISSIEFRLERINTIKTLLDGNPKIVVSNINGLLKLQQAPAMWEKYIIDLNEGQEINRDELLQKLFDMGYHQNYIVSNVGDFSFRGSIIDIFPLNSALPIRIDLFGDFIDSIKEFDLNKQTSINQIKHTTIVPLNEVFYDDKLLTEALNSIKERFNNLLVSDQEYFNKDLKRFRERKNLDLLNKYLEFFNAQSTILDFAENRSLYIVEPYRAQTREKRMYEELNEFADGIHINFLKQLRFFTTLADIYKTNTVNYFYNLVDIDGRNNLYAKDVIRYGNNIEMFMQELRNHPDDVFLIALRNYKRIEEIKEALASAGIKYSNITKSDEIIGAGVYLFYDDQALSVEQYAKRVTIITDDNIFSNIYEQRRFRYKSVLGEGRRLKSVDDLTAGDYVVHYDYGIGIYLGLKTVQLENDKRDYIHIMYAKDAAVYVPMEAIDLVQKYCGREGYKPPLSELGTNKWANTKARVKKKIKDISDKLIKIYAERESAVGHAFPIDFPEQSEFENDFPYEETLDQIKAISEMKHDMERQRPMDRLICGDVGYGKTEIAMRGAFKAIMGGKQVAYLAPTTMLSRQHYYTFKKRFERFGAQIALLNRFVSTKKQKEILKKVKSGEVDCLIGTHRILSKDIEFKDLGLLVIDEEQRFGVEHKERIKEMKINVDTLTLTATPIPRTLQMSIMGIKDISILNTPPKNRYPIQTYVLERNDLIIKDAIERELSRHGQVFYLYNKTQTIEQMAAKINRMVPQAKVAFAHGKMNKYELEEIIEAFIDQEYDVLVCTTIIETGIDIPNTNTIIVHDADMLGLAQLYQIRGRVGRSDRIAYSYLMYDSKKVLNDNSMKRLEAIKDFTELGSGYKIAMRDLSIRGAGDVLGSEQSGFVDSVGIELYLKILENTVKEVQGIDVNEEKEVGKAMSSRHVPTSYISDDGVRIDIHKKIDQLQCLADLGALQSELRDRFGQVDEKLNFYMYEKLFKRLAKKLGARSIIEERGILKIVFSRKASEMISGEKLFFAAKDVEALKIGYFDKEINLTLAIYEVKDSWVKVMCTFFDYLLNA